MNNEHDKKIKTLISGLMSGDDTKVTRISRDLVESIVTSKEDEIIECLINKFKGETDV
jgi:hypothetical protein